MTKKIKIARIEIDLERKVIRAFDSIQNPMIFPLDKLGSTELKWTNISAGGHLIRSLERMLEGVKDYHNMK